MASENKITSTSNREWQNNNYHPVWAQVVSCLLCLLLHAHLHSWWGYSCFERLTDKWTDEQLVKTKSKNWSFLVYRYFQTSKIKQVFVKKKKIAKLSEDSYSTRKSFHRPKKYHIIMKPIASRWNTINNLMYAQKTVRKNSTSRFSM